MSMIWLYPISETSGSYFEVGTWRSADTSPGAFREMIRRGGDDGEWPIATNFRNVTAGDMVVIYASKTRRGERPPWIVGFGRVAHGPYPRRDGCYGIRIEWDLERCRRLCESPLDATGIAAQLQMTKPTVTKLPESVQRELRVLLGLGAQGEAAEGPREGSSDGVTCGGASFNSPYATPERISDVASGVSVRRVAEKGHSAVRDPWRSAMTFEDVAKSISSRVRATGRGFLTLRKDELREAFGVGRLTESQADQIDDALEDAGVYVFPHPYVSGATLRLYDHKHPIGELAVAVAEPENTTDAPLRRAADSFARERAGRDLRSEDVSWLEALEIFLQLVMGREPQGWEDLRDQRHGSMLARELAAALDLEPAVAESPTVIKLAAAVCCLRPKARGWNAADLATDPESSYAAELVTILDARDRRVREELDRALRAAARVLLDGKEIPGAQVELGTLGMRRRRENDF